jgi:hypothetical protein
VGDGCNFLSADMQFSNSNMRPGPFADGRSPLEYYRLAPHSIARIIQLLSLTGKLTTSRDCRVSCAPLTRSIEQPHQKSTRLCESPIRTSLLEPFPSFLSRRMLAVKTRGQGKSISSTTLPAIPWGEEHIRTNSILVRAAAYPHSRTDQPSLKIINFEFNVVVSCVMHRKRP